MQKTVDQVRQNKTVLAACIELLIRERRKGKSLRQLGQMSGRSHERIRQILARYDPAQEALTPESVVAAKLGYPVEWLTRLRKEGALKPIKRGFWLYSVLQRMQPSI